MMIEYARVTRSSDGTIDCTGSTTARAYTDVEFVDNSMVESPPSEGDVGIIMEIGNAEVVWVGGLKQFVSALLPKELRLRPGQSTGIVFTGVEPNTQTVSLYRCTVTSTGTGEQTQYEYEITEEVKIDDTGNIIIQRLNNGIPTSKIQLHDDDKLTVSNTNCTIVVSAAGGIDITANSNINITAPIINLN